MRKFYEQQAAKLGLVGAAAVAFVNNAMAAVPTEVTTAITAAGTDMGVVASACFIAVIGLLGWKLMRKAAH